VLANYLNCFFVKPWPPSKNFDFCIDTVKERSPEPEPEVDIMETQESIPNIDEIEELPVSSTTSSSHKRKKRKIIDKLVMTDDGFMGTNIFDISNNHCWSLFKYAVDVEGQGGILP